jgi:hypothetical protein
MKSPGHDGLYEDLGEQKGLANSWIASVCSVEDHVQRIVISCVSPAIVRVSDIRPLNGRARVAVNALGEFDIIQQVICDDGK